MSASKKFYVITPLFIVGQFYYLIGQQKNKLKIHSDIMLLHVGIPVACIYELHPSDAYTTVYGQGGIT